MELMSSLLLCALAALLPQALGFKANFITEVKRDAPTKIVELPTFRKSFWLKRKTPSDATIKMVLKYLRAEGCSMCIACINSALHVSENDAEKMIEAKTQHIHSRDYIFNDIIENYHQHKIVRNKRETKNIISTKSKRNQMNISKNATVNKYYIDGQVYAIKLWEKNSIKAGILEGQTCHVYSVKKNYPCESSQADSILTNAKKMANKRRKKQAKVTLTTGKPTNKKSQVPPREKTLAESFMTSIEELYN